MTERLQQRWSPEPIAGRLRREGRLQISHETIYRYVWADKRHGGTLYTHLRGAQKRRRKRYGAYDSRGRLAGKRPISTRSHAAEARTRVGHWEADTVLGAGQAGPCVFTMVERKTGYLAIGQLAIRRATAVNARATQLIRAQPRPGRTRVSTRFSTDTVKAYVLNAEPSPNTNLRPATVVIVFWASQEPGECSRNDKDCIEVRWSRGGKTETGVRRGRHFGIDVLSVGQDVEATGIWYLVPAKTLLKGDVERIASAIWKQNRETTYE